MPNKVDYRTFSQRVKNKYPEYINMGDLELAQMWVSQNPQYGEFVMFDQQPVKKKDQAAPSLGAQGGLPSQQPSAQPRKAREERFFGGTFGDLLDALDMPTPGVPGSGLGIGDFIDDMGRAFSSGKKAGVNISTSRPLFFSGPGSSDEEVQNFVKAGTEYTGPSDEATQFYKDYEDNGKTTFGFVKALAKNPRVAPELVVQSASQFLFNPEARAAFGASIAAGAGIGALASAPLGGIGAAPGAIAAILPGVAAANTAVSTLSSFSELMKQELDQRGLEFNEDNVRTILEDEKALRKIRAKSAGYGITIGAFDLATAKVGGAIAAKIPMTTRAGKIKSTLATTGAEAVGGSAGEAAARGVTGQELDPAEIGLEGIAEIPGAAPTLLSQVLKRPTYKINGEFVGQADVDDILQNSSRQELENTKFEVFNDVNMYGLKFRNRLEDLGLLEEITEANPNASEADINRLFELNSKLKKVENLNSESAKASADWLRSQIREVQDGLLTQEFAPQEVQQVEEAAPEAPQMALTEVSPEVGMEIPQEDQGVLQVINSVVQPISSDLEARMNNAEEIPMSEIEAVVDALIDAQQSVRSQEGARTRQTQGGFVTEFGALSDQQKRNFDTLIEQQINKLLNYEFATITTTEQAGEKTKTAGLVATPREGRPLPESVVSRDRFDGAGVRVGGRGAGRITVKRIPGFGGRSVYGVSFGNRKGVAPVEDLEFDNLEFVAPEILADGSFNARVKDSKSGLEFTITDPELSIDLAIAAQLKEAGRKEFPQPAFLEAVREVTQGQPTQVTTFPNLGRTGTTPAAVGVEPQTEQDVRQETNAPQEGRAQGENAAPVPQEEGRQEGQVTPPAVAQEGETPPATGKKTRKTEQQKADERNAAEEELRKALGVLQAGKKKPLFQRPGQKAEIDEDTQIELASEEAGISPKNFRDLYRVNRELFGLNQSEAMSAAIAMDKMIGVMAKRAGVSKTEMYGRLNFKKATEQDLPQSAIKQDKEEILRVFHGTSKDKDFKKFKDTGKGVFVTISPKEASEYAEQNDSMKFGDYDPITRRFREINTASRVIPMNLNLGNSYKLTKADIEFLNSKPNYSALQKELHARIKANGFDTIDYGNGVYAVLTEGRLRSMLTNEALFQKDLPQGVKFQVDAVKARGAMMIALDGQATIYALTDPNVSTPLHELAHVFEHYLTDEEKATVQEWAKTKDWTIKTSEAFARGFEKYLAEGKAPTPALQKIFDNFKQWLTDIYRGIVGSDIDVELNEPMRDLYAKMFEFTGEDGQSNFEKWKGDNNLLVGPDIQDAKTGEPIVVRAYHGTTNEFYEFDSSVKGSVEGHLGKINYFTSDYQDAAINYLSEGTDLTNRVEGRTEQIISELENNYDDYNESIPELSKKYGYTEEELEDDFVSFRSLARDLAKKELYGGTNKVLDVFIKLNNPVVLGKGSTWFQTLNISEADLDQAAQEIADENDISVEEAKQDYDFDIRDRAIENSGYENLAVDALSSALRSNGYRGASASEILGDNLYESEIDLNRLEGELRRNDKAGLYENEEGELASSQVVSDFLKNLGFDGIILTDVSSRFRGMGLGSSTSHIHVFDEFANQIKLADGSNTTFGETRDIRFQLDKAQPQQQAQPEAQVDATAKALEDALAPDDAFEMYRLSHVSDKGFVLQKSWIEEKLIELLPKIGARRFASLVREYVDEYFSASILKTPGMSFGELIGYLIGDGNLVYQGTETKWAELLKSQGVDVPSPKPGNVTYNPIRISEAYHKAKADGSNPKLVQAVDELLGQTPEAKPAKTIAEQRKEFRETAKKYFDGLKKMGIAFDPERNSKEDIAFLKALAKYIKLELDNGMVTFKGFLEKTSNLIEGFNEKAVVEAAKEAWAKEVVKAYPKLYAKYSAAKRKELEREIKDIKKTMIRKIREMTDPKIVNFKSQLKTEKRRLSKEAAAQLAAINNAYDAKTMMAMEPQDLMELLNLTEGIYKEGRSEIKALNESLDEAAQIQGEEMLAAITSKDKRLDKLSDKEAARRKLKFKSGVVVAVNNDERVMLKEEAELDALTGEGYNFFFLNTTGDKVVNRGFLDSVASFFSGKLRTINENARDLRTALELIKSKSKESQDFINGLVAKMNKASVTKARKSEEWSSILKDARTRFFGPDIKFGYTNWMNAIAKVDGKALELIDGSGEPIGPINNGKIVSLYRQLMDPTNLVKTDNVRKINLSDESIQSIIDYMNLPANKPGKDFALSLTEFFLKVAKDTKAVLENNGYNSTKLDEKRYNTEDFEGDEFIAQVMGQFADTRTEGFIPYTPIQATESPDTAQGVEIKEDDLFNSGDLQKNFSVISNNMITRRPGGVIVPTDIRQTLNAYTAGMANMNAKLPLLRETQSVFSNRNLKAMSNAFAPQFTENLKANYISFMTDRVTKVDSSKSWQAIKTWLMASTAIPMFLNVKSSVLQLLASPNFMASYDFSKYIDASKKLLGDPALFKKIFVEIIDLPTVRQRFGSRFSPDSRIISEEVGRYGKVAIKIPFTNISISAKELLSKGYVFSSIGDVVSIAIGGAPIYYDISQTNKKKYIAEGMSVLDAETKAKQDAEERLFEIIQETQQSSEAMYLSEFQKQSITRLFSSFATATQQYYRKARRAAARMKNKEGEQLQNAYEILHYTAINAAVFQFFSSMFVDWLSGPGEDELEEMSREERMDLVRYMEDVMATVAQGTGGMGVALQALILAIKEGKKSGKPEKIAESALRTMPAVRMKYDAAINTMREWKRGDYVRSLTKGAELANIPADRIRSLGLQVSDALMENLDAQERIARLMGFRTESWMREKKQGEIWNGVQSTIDKSTPAERQRAISNTKSAYRDLFQLYGKRYAEATTEAEKARVDSIASKELINVYNHRQGGQELTEELQKLFNQSIEFNSLPKDLQKLKNMETNRKIGDVVEEVLSLEKKSEQKAMEYWSSLVNNGILSDKEIDRIREEYNTRKGLQ